ncbi:hypothetical protein [Ruminococcus sp. HUN007]|uniref:hypothetical protein n=1 Tax=Ruminococcus sp. HUN007 TaxID=1514668 RepID=UPI0005D2333F|nr:hypothetical protein [Ruminococcus sp. HUN007]
MKNQDKQNQNENLNAEEMSQNELSTDSSKSVVPNKETDVTQIVVITYQKIKDGLANPTASTGTAIAELTGMAKTLAQLANIGRGSKATGGGGVEEGIETIMDLAKAQGFIEGTAGGDGAAGVTNNLKPLTGPTGNKGLTDGAEVVI